MDTATISLAHTQFLSDIVRGYLDSAEEEFCEENRLPKLPKNCTGWSEKAIDEAYKVCWQFFQERSTELGKFAIDFVLHGDEEEMTPYELAGYMFWQDRSGGNTFLQFGDDPDYDILHEYAFSFVPIFPRMSEDNALFFSESE